MKIANLALMIPGPALPSTGEDLRQPLDRLALPGAHLVRMDLVLRRDLLKRPITPKRLQRNLRLQLPQNFRRFPLSRIPPSDGGIHLSDLSDFPGPPQDNLLRDHN